jgi:protein SCO1/2
MSSRLSASLNLVLALILTGLLAFPTYGHLPMPPKKGETRRKAAQISVPDFTLIDQDGKLFRFSSARGKVIVTTFIFTTCPDVCPLITAKLAAIQRSLDAKKQDNYLLLSITTDPEKDTAPALKAYGEQYKADFRQWLFLTGPRDDLTNVWKSFGVNVSKTAGGQVQHTAVTTLIDKQGTRRVDYYTDKWHEKELLKDLTWLESLGSR